MDLSKISTADLQALQSGDLSKVSTQTLQMLHQGAGQTGTAAPPKQDASRLIAPESGVTDFAKGAWHGVTSPVRGARQLYNWATNDTETLNRLQREEEEDYNKLGGWGKAGNIAGNVATAFIPAGAAAKAGQLGAKALQVGSTMSKVAPVTTGLLGGAASGALNPVMAERGVAQDDFGWEKAKDIGIGAGLGGVAGQASKFFRPGSAAVQQASKDLGGIATPGQLLTAKAGPEGLLKNATEWERRLGMVLPGSGILSRRDLAHEAGVTGMLAKEAEKAGINVGAGKNFKDVYKTAQEEKGKGYEAVVKDLKLANPINTFASSFHKHADDLTDPVRQDVISAIRQSGVKDLTIGPNGKVHIGNIAGKTQRGTGGQGGFQGYEGANVQNVLSTLNKEISSRFGQNATRQDNVAGEALVKIRDDILANVQKNSGDAFDKYQSLNRLHQMTGPDTQTKRGVFGRAAGYVNARERGTPTLRELSQAAGAGRQTKARNEVAEQAARLEDIAGKHSTTGQGELSKLFRAGQGLLMAGQGAATLGANFSPRLVYNERMLKKLNKLAQEGSPEAQKMLVQAGTGLGGINLD